MAPIGGVSPAVFIDRQAMELMGHQPSAVFRFGTVGKNGWFFHQINNLAVNLLRMNIFVQHQLQIPGAGVH